MELSGATIIRLIIAVLAAFTGIHLAAWNYPFPSVAEVWMWRAAVLLLFVAGAVTVRIIELESHRAVLITISRVSLLVYLLCRIMTVVLAFAALRHSPAEVYQRPNWTAYWGHIGS